MFAAEKQQHYYYNRGFYKVKCYFREYSPGIFYLRDRTSGRANKKEE
jgi:hypothetical protein